MLSERNPHSSSPPATTNNRYSDIPNIPQRDLASVTTRSHIHSSESKIQMISSIVSELKANNQSLIKNYLHQHIRDPSSILHPNIYEKHFPNDAYYEGEFNQSDERHGRGIFKYKNGDIYIGDWKDDKFHGKGYYLFLNGERYEGYLENGFKCGQGKYFYSNGNIHYGQWSKDKKEGEGVLIYRITNEKFEGEFKGGEKNGLGVWTYANGVIYQGGFVGGRKSGVGR